MDIELNIETLTNITFYKFVKIEDLNALKETLDNFEQIKTFINPN